MGYISHLWFTSRPILGLFDFRLVATRGRSPRDSRDQKRTTLDGYWGSLADRLDRNDGVHLLTGLSGLAIGCQIEAVDEVIRNYVASQIRKSSHAAIQYNIHFVFSVRRRIEFLDPFVGQKRVQYWLSVCQKKSWIAWDIEVVWDHAHLLLGISPGETPEEAALALLNNTELWFHDRYSAAMQLEALETVFQPGYYAGTCGEATTAQIKSYLAFQFDAD